MIKLTGNRETYAKMADNIDIDASPLIYQPKDKDALLEHAVQVVLDTINGVPTRAEAYGFVETAIARVCNYV